MNGKPKQLPLTLAGIFVYSIWSVFISTGSAGFVYMVLAVDVSPFIGTAGYSLLDGP